MLTFTQAKHAVLKTCILVVAALLPPMSLRIIDFLLGSLKSDSQFWSLVNLNFGSLKSDFQFWSLVNLNFGSLKSDLLCKGNWGLVKDVIRL